MTLELADILNYLLGGSSVASLLFGFQSRRKLQKVEAEKAHTDHMQVQLDHALAINDNLLKRISEANRAVDTHVDRTRELSDRIWKAEQECNRLNERNHSQGERITRLLLETEHWKHWHCRRCDCQDPRGREPSQDPPEQRYLPFTPAGD